MSVEQSNSDSNYENSNPNSNETDEPIYVMTLELEKGRAEQIKIYADSDANELAYAFCKEHDLDFSALEYLKERIESLLSQIRERTESQGSQIEEVDDEHINTEDNRYNDYEKGNQNQREYITEENGQESKKETIPKEKEMGIGKINKKNKEIEVEEVMRQEHEQEHERISMENMEDSNDIAKSNSIGKETLEKFDYEQVELPCNTNNNYEDKEKEDLQKENKEEMTQSNKDDIGKPEEEMAKDNSADEQEDQDQEEEHNQDNEFNNTDKNQCDNNDNQNVQVTNELIIEENTIEKGPNKKTKTDLQIDPYYDQVNREQIELENEDDLNSSINNNDNNGTLKNIDNEIVYQKKSQQAPIKDLNNNKDKGKLFQTEQPKPYTNKNNKVQSHLESLAPLSSTQHNESKKNKNYFRTTKPLFSQHIQSTVNTKPQTQTEQKSTSHSPPQSNTTHPTLNNNTNNTYTIKPLVMTPNQKETTHQVHQSYSSSNKKKSDNEEEEEEQQKKQRQDEEEEEEEKVKDISLQHNRSYHPCLNPYPYSNHNRYYSYLSQKQSDTNQNIFDRLFRDAEIKRILPYQCYNSNNVQSIYQEKKTIYNTIANSNANADKQANNNNNNTNTKPSNMNYGEYLYSKDKILKEEKEKQISQIKEYQAEQERYSFKPTISSEYKLHTNLSNPSIRRVDKMERMKKELSEVYTFKPKINNTYNTELSFNDRQDFFANLYKQRNYELNQIINSKQDEKGNVMFHPQLISKQTESNQQQQQQQQAAATEVNCFDKNYNYALQYRKNREELSNKIYNDKQKNISVYKNNQTDKIIVSIHKEAFGKLFKELNNNQDGQLTPFSLSTKKIPRNILAIISPLLFELKEDNQTLNESEFVSAMEQLFKEISVIEQRMLINTYKRQSNRSKSKGMFTESNTHSYKPIINSNTSKLAMKYDTKMAERYPGVIGQKKENVNRSNFFKSNSKRTLETLPTFTNIHNYTFDNYVKKLN